MYNINREDIHMITIEQIINDPKCFNKVSNIKAFFKLPSERMLELTGHPDRRVRLAAVSHAIIEDVPLFISDLFEKVQDRAAVRLRRGY